MRFSSYFLNVRYHGVGNLLCWNAAEGLMLEWGEEDGDEKMRGQWHSILKIFLKSK
jgi:hypothetical protein